MNEHKCPNCGGISHSEICPYCGTVLAEESKDLPPEYPILQCKEARISFLNTGFPMIVSAMTGWPGISMLLSMLRFREFSETGLFDQLFSLGPILLGIVLAFIGLIALVIGLLPTARIILVSVKGREKSAVVQGYLDDDTMVINGNRAKAVKLLVPTGNGPRIILYQMGKTYKPYVVGSRITIKSYKQYFRIIEEKLS